MNITGSSNLNWYSWHWTLATRTQNISAAAEAVKITAYTTEAALGLVVNTILICAIVLGSHTSKQVHIQLINLAIADILSGAMLWVTVMRTEELPMFTYFARSQPLCTFYVYLYSSLSYICVLWGLAVSVERFIAIYFPLQLRYVTRKKKILSALLVWMTCFLLGIYGASQASYIEFSIGPDMLAQCYQHPNLPYSLYFNISVSLVPVIITILVYTLIARKLCCKKQIGETEQPSQFNQNFQIILMLAADAFFNLLSTICSIAPQVANLQWKTNGEPYPSQVYAVICAVVLSNCFITPVFYYIFNKSIRKDIRDLFKRMCKSSSKQKEEFTSDRHKNTKQTRLDMDSSAAPMLESDSSV